MTAGTLMTMASPCFLQVVSLASAAWRICSGLSCLKISCWILLHVSAHWMAFSTRCFFLMAVCFKLGTLDNSNCLCLVAGKAASG